VRYKSIIPAALAAALLAAAAPAPASAAEPELEIVRVGYNAAGPDTLQNRWQEYVDLRNVSDDAVNVKGWFVQDRWAHSKYGNKAKASDCNTAIFTKEALPYLDTDADDDGNEDGLWLPKGHYIRIYTGGAQDLSNNNVHSMAINKPSCGYNGHFWNNTGDTVYVKRADGSLVTSFSYDFKQGYWVTKG